jgi:hypothetical protein
VLEKTNQRVKIPKALATPEGQVTIFDPAQPIVWRVFQR